MDRCFVCGKEINEDFPEDLYGMYYVTRGRYPYYICANCYDKLSRKFIGNVPNDFLNDSITDIWSRDKEKEPNALSSYKDWVTARKDLLDVLNNGDDYLPDELHMIDYSNDYLDYNPKFKLIRDLDEPTESLLYTYGFELEMEYDTSRYESKHSAAAGGLDLLTDFDLSFRKGGQIRLDLYSPTTDGSLDDGVEFRTLPMTRKFCTDLWLPGLKKIFSNLIDDGWTCHDGGRCGLHMHFSRLGIRPENTVTLWYLINGFSELLLPLSMRQGTSYCEFKRWSAKRVKERGHLTYAELSAMYYLDNCRYKALNIDDRKNPNTLEMRFMRGTLKWSSFIGRVHTMFALIDMAKMYSLDYALKLTTQDLWRWFKSYSTELNDYCEYVRTKRNIEEYIM